MWIATGTKFSKYCREYPQARKALLPWRRNVVDVIWRSPAQLKSMYGSASILKGSRVVFNIAGNKFRLITLIRFEEGVIDLIWFGTHYEYDKINAQEIKYVPD